MISHEHDIRGALGIGGARRSRQQVAALDWSGDPTAVLDGLFVFGPRDDALVE